MCRESMHSDWGMLFFMPTNEVQRFWMKNTLIPLDMVFLNEAWQIIGIVENTVPQSLQGRGVAGASRYVLELNAGTANRLGLENGTSARFYGPRQP